MLKIVKWPDPILMKPCESWDFMNPPSQVDFLMSEMIETMAKSGGIGLAANQVGIPYRLMAMHVQETDEYITLFNPILLATSDPQYTANEGCLSFPGVILNIERPKEVVVKYQDHLEQWHLRTFTDIDAKCFLHELDHLNGKTFKDYVSDLKYNMALKKAKKNGN
jgi:peptide deformylase